MSLTLQVLVLGLSLLAGSSLPSSSFASLGASSGASWGTGVTGEVETRGTGGKTLAGVVGVG